MKNVRRQECRSTFSSNKFKVQRLKITKKRGLSHTDLEMTDIKNLKREYSNTGLYQDAWNGQFGLFTHKIGNIGIRNFLT